MTQLVTQSLFLTSMLQELHQQFVMFFHAVRSWLILYLLMTLLLFSGGVGEYTWFGKTGYFFSFSGESFAALLFKQLVTDIAPAAVPIIVTSPLTAFVLQVKLALLSAFILTLPMLLYTIGSFVAPALYRRERLILVTLVGCASGLFLAGAVFAYTFIAPVTLQVLYEFTAPIGVTALLSSDSLVAMVFALVFVTGVAFTLPVMMVVLSALGVVAPVVWTTHWRQVLVAILVISAIITPDGSGVSMVLLSVPTTLLYGCGIVVSRIVTRPVSGSVVTNR